MTTPAKTWKIELHGLPSATLTDREFLTGAAGRPVVLSAALRLPPGAARVPAVILLHGSGGLSGYVDDWARHLNAQGAAALLVDSFTGRGIDTTFADQDALGRLAMILDAYRALDMLAGHPRIDPERISLMGFSRGGQAALYAAVQRFATLHGPRRGRYARHIAFYPACQTRYLEDERLLAVPVHVLHGSADEMNPIESCRDYVARARAAGARIDLHEFRGAHHVFDWPLLAQPIVLRGAKSHRGDRLEERLPGEIVVARTGAPAATAHYESDPTLAYDAAAHAAAQRIVGELIASP